MSTKKTAAKKTAPKSKPAAKKAPAKKAAKKRDHAAERARRAIRLDQEQFQLQQKFRSRKLNFTFPTFVYQWTAEDIDSETVYSEETKQHEQITVFPSPNPPDSEHPWDVKTSMMSSDGATVLFLWQRPQSPEESVSAAIALDEIPPELRA